MSMCRCICLCDVRVFFIVNSVRDLNRHFVGHDAWLSLVCLCFCERCPSLSF